MVRVGYFDLLKVSIWLVLLSRLVECIIWFHQLYSAIKGCVDIVSVMMSAGWWMADRKDSARSVSLKP